MGEAQIRTTYDFILVYNVTAPVAGAPAQLSALLTAAQRNEIAAATSAGYIVCGVQITAPATINWQHATPGTLVTVSPQAGLFPIAANQKPNEIIPSMQADKQIFIVSNTAGTVPLVALGFLCVSKDTV